KIRLPRLEASGEDDRYLTSLLERYDRTRKRLATAVSEDCVVSIRECRTTGQVNSCNVLRNRRARNTQSGVTGSRLNANTAIGEQTVINIHLRIVGGCILRYQSVRVMRENGISHGRARMYTGKDAGGSLLERATVNHRDYLRTT